MKRCIINYQGSVYQITVRYHLSYFCEMVIIRKTKNNKPERYVIKGNLIHLMKIQSDTAFI